MADRKVVLTGNGVNCQCGCYCQAGGLCVCETEGFGCPVVGPGKASDWRGVFGTYGCRELS